MEDRFELAAWKVPSPTEKERTERVPFPLLGKLPEGTTVLWVLDAKPVHCAQHFDQGKGLLVCAGQDCLFCAQGYGTRREEFWFVNVLDRKDGQVKVFRYSRNLAGPLQTLIQQEGDPRQYDLVITRTGLKRDTRYAITKGDTMPVEVDAAKRFNLETLLAPMPRTEQAQYLAAKRARVEHRIRDFYSSSRPIAIEEGMVPRSEPNPLDNADIMA